MEAQATSKINNYSPDFSKNELQQKQILKKDQNLQELVIELNHELIIFKEKVATICEKLAHYCN